MHAIKIVLIVILISLCVLYLVAFAGVIKDLYENCFKKKANTKICRKQNNRRNAKRN